MKGDDPGCIINKRLWEEIVKHGKPKGLTEVSWVDESVVLREPSLYVPSYYRAVEVAVEKGLGGTYDGQKAHA